MGALLGKDGRKGRYDAEGALLSGMERVFADLSDGREKERSVHRHS
jgi:hypothetical protein